MASYCTPDLNAFDWGWFKVICLFMIVLTWVGVACRCEGLRGLILTGLLFV